MIPLTFSLKRCFNYSYKYWLVFFLIHTLRLFLNENHAGTKMERIVLLFAVKGRDSDFLTVCKIKMISSQMDFTTCGQTKGCFMMPNGCNPNSTCSAVVGYRQFDSEWVELELMGKTTGASNNNYVALGFSQDQNMVSSFRKWAFHKKIFSRQKPQWLNVRRWMALGWVESYLIMMWLIQELTNSHR